MAYGNSLTIELGEQQGYLAPTTRCLSHLERGHGVLSQKPEPRTKP